MSRKQKHLKKRLIKTSQDQTQWENLDRALSTLKYHYLKLLNLRVHLGITKNSDKYHLKLQQR